jgi:flagellar basal body L-ring protein FlgH
MLAFEIQINGKKRCTAGLGKPGVLTAALSWVLRTPEGRRRQSEELNLGVCGLVSRSDEDLVWLQRAMRLGDEVTIRIVEVADADTPKKRRRDRATPAQILRRRKAFLRRLAKEFGWKIVTQ